MAAADSERPTPSCAVNEFNLEPKWCERLPTGPRRLVLLLDGTWNKREDTTNVWRMRTMLARRPDQLVYYDEGVGTAKGEAVAGGAFGSGLSAKVLGAYVWLMEHYEHAHESPSGYDDEVFVFGFSRGAYAARSLIGLLAISGLLHRDASQRIIDAFEFSRLDGLNELSPIAAAYRTRFSRQVRIKFVGVWDAVEALGLPRLKGLPPVRLSSLEDNSRHKVHELPSIVEHARQAIALDEHRFIFEPALWPRSARGQSMEQRWFIGAHANVGGGYGNDGLFRRPLQWLQSEAALLGLVFRHVVADLGELFYCCAPRDPLDEVGYGAYKLTQWMKPHKRVVTLGDVSKQTIDYTVMERYAWSPVYAPLALRELLPRKPDRRPPCWMLSDQQIMELLNIPCARVSATRGFLTVN